MWKVENNQLIIPKHKCVLVLTQTDVDIMLNQHPDIMIEALKRGKYHRRADQNMKRRVPHHHTFDPKVEWRDDIGEEKT